MRWLFISILTLLWSATLVLGGCLVFGVDLGFKAEPVTGFLGTLSTGLTAVISYFGIQLRATERELEEERFSTPMALAFGYVRNFLEPALTTLLAGADGEKCGGLKIYIYIPDRLEELEPLSRQRVLARIRENDFSEGIFKLEPDGSRVRDLITITKSGEDQPRYFDFPTTLLTLTSLVDYKIATSGDRHPQVDREALGREYIGKFRDYLMERVEALGLGDRVALTDGELGFLSEIGQPNEGGGEGAGEASAAAR